MKIISNSSIEYERVKTDISYLNQIPQQSYELCLSAVQINPKAILYMRHPYEDIYIYAVSKRGDLLKHITQPTEAICLSAVKKEGLA